jgi:hypothetical protein
MAKERRKVKVTDPRKRRRTVKVTDPRKRRRTVKVTGPRKRRRTEIVTDPKLEAAIETVLALYPKGLRHAELVTAVLEAGYRPADKRTSISPLVHEAALRLMNKNRLSKHDDRYCLASAR